MRFVAACIVAAVSGKVPFNRSPNRADRYPGSHLNERKAVESASLVLSPHRRVAGSASVSVEAEARSQPAEYFQNQRRVVLWDLEFNNERAGDHPVNFEAGLAAMRRAGDVEEYDLSDHKGPLGI